MYYVHRIINLEDKHLLYLFRTYFFQQAENFCNAIGILQQIAPPSKFAAFDRNGSQTPQQQEGIIYTPQFFMFLSETT